MDVPLTLPSPRRGEGFLAGLSPKGGEGFLWIGKSHAQKNVGEVMMGFSLLTFKKNDHKDHKGR